jgi:Kinesin motor domain
VEVPESKNNDSVVFLGQDCHHDDYFAFDRVYNEQASQKELFDCEVRSIVQEVVSKGINGTILTYGQTGRYFFMHLTAVQTKCAHMDSVPD